MLCFIVYLSIRYWFVCFSNPTSPPSSPIGSVPWVPSYTISSPAFKGVTHVMSFKQTSPPLCTTGLLSIFKQNCDLDLVKITIFFFLRRKERKISSFKLKYLFLWKQAQSRYKDKENWRRSFIPSGMMARWEKKLTLTLRKSRIHCHYRFQRSKIRQCTHWEWLPVYPWSLSTFMFWFKYQGFNPIDLCLF